MAITAEQVIGAVIVRFVEDGRPDLAELFRRTDLTESATLLAEWSEEAADWSDADKLIGARDILAAKFVAADGRRRFRLGEVLSIVTGEAAFSDEQRRVDLLTYMTGEPSLREEHVEAATALCRESLLRQHPGLAEVKPTERDLRRVNLFLPHIAEKHGATMDVVPLPACAFLVPPPAREVAEPDAGAAEQDDTQIKVIDAAPEPQQVVLAEEPTEEPQA